MDRFRCDTGQLLSVNQYLLRESMANVMVREVQFIVYWNIVLVITQ